MSIFLLMLFFDIQNKNPADPYIMAIFVIIYRTLFVPMPVPNSEHQTEKCNTVCCERN